MQRTNSLENTLMLGEIQGKRRQGWQRMRWLDNITDSIDMNLSKLWETVENRWAWCAAVYEIIDNQTRFSDWTTATASRVFLDQGLNPCLCVGRQIFLPLSHQGSPLWLIFNFRLRCIVRDQWVQPPCFTHWGNWCWRSGAVGSRSPNQLWPSS